MKHLEVDIQGKLKMVKIKKDIEIKEIQKTNLKEGDVLFIRLPEKVSDRAVIDQIGNIIKRVFPKNKFLVLEKGININIYSNLEKEIIDVMSIFHFVKKKIINFIKK